MSIRVPFVIGSLIGFLVGFVVGMLIILYRERELLRDVWRRNQIK